MLLTSSLTMALAVCVAAENGRPARHRAFPRTDDPIWNAFLGVKAYEYYHKFEERLVPGRSFTFEASHTSGQESDSQSLAARSTVADDFQSESVELFFSFYFGMTGLHAMHMVIGIAILGVLLAAARTAHFQLPTSRRWK